MVTAELAVGLPVVVLVAMSAVGIVALVLAQLRCDDAAAQAARLASRGESAGQVQAFVRADAPAGATVALGTPAPGEVQANVQAVLRLPLVGAIAPVRVSAHVVDPLEPGMTQGPGPPVACAAPP